MVCCPLQRPSVFSGACSSSFLWASSIFAWRIWFPFPTLVSGLQHFFEPLILLCTTTCVSRGGGLYELFVLNDLSSTFSLILVSRKELNLDSSPFTQEEWVGYTRGSCNIPCSALYSLPQHYKCMSTLYLDTTFGFIFWFGNLLHNSPKLIIYLKPIILLP